MTDSVRHPSVLTLDEAILRFAREKRNGRRVVFTNGCFDVLHPGHIAILEFAKNQGDVLIVGLNADKTVLQLKGAGRPANPQEDRAEILASLEAVDAVVIFHEPTPRELIARLLPDVLVKGGDWAVDQIVGREEVEGAGGQVMTVPVKPTFSTTSILQKIRESGPSSAVHPSDSQTKP